MAASRGPEGREGQTGREGIPGREGLPGIDGLVGDTGHIGARGPRGGALPRTIMIAFSIMVVLFFAILIGFAWVVTDVQDNQSSITTLAENNTDRIKDIQTSRVESCKRTYSGIREVFTPFFPPPPRTHKQIEDLDKFNTTINRLINACVKQVDTKVKPESKER